LRPKERIETNYFLTELSITVSAAVNVEGANLLILALCNLRTR